MRYEVVGEHREPRGVAPGGDTGPLEVGGCDLCAFEKRHRDLLVARAVGEARPAAEPRGERHRRAARGVDESEHVAAALVEQARPQVAQRQREQLHQLVLGVLVQDLGDGGGLDRRKLRGGGRAGAFAVGSPRRRDRPEAGTAGRLAQRRKPARAEVDRVERQPVGGELGAGRGVVAARELVRAGPERARSSALAYGSTAAWSMRTLRARPATSAAAARSSRSSRRRSPGLRTSRGSEGTAGLGLVTLTSCPDEGPGAARSARRRPPGRSLTSSAPP